MCVTTIPTVLRLEAFKRLSSDPTISDPVFCLNELRVISVRGKTNEQRTLQTDGGTFEKVILFYFLFFISVKKKIKYNHIVGLI